MRGVRCSSPNHRRRRPLALVLPLALLLAGCSGTPLGDQLSDSFPDGQAAEEPSPAPGTDPEPAATAPAAAGPPAPAQPGPAAPQGPAAPAAAPAPYRLTLRLSGADPAAPAEAVTQALRAAGLSFEVEVIERIPEAAAPPPPLTTPAPEPAPAPANR
ncbi:MAG: hypothetical protein EA413_05405 [Cyanobium sp. PLM2.Bin73]|nr:MAG: hypothetical protein EA413_05405 [Cyanobium sp. PLM2.Bin73]